MTTTGVTKNNLNLREKGSTDATIIKTLPAGTTVTIQSGIGTAWLYVTAPDSSVGYVSSVYVTIAADAAAVAPPATVTVPPATIPAPVAVQAAVQPTTVTTPTTPATPISPSPSSTVPTAAKALTPTGDHGQMVNIRAQGAITGTLVTQATNGDVLTPLESDASVAAKIGTPATKNQWINVKTASGKVGFIAAWLAAYWTASAGTTSTNTASTPGLSPDDYIASISPTEAPTPQGYTDFWAQSQTIGLPAPFDVLPAQLAYPDIARTPVNGFGPNTFSFHNWPRWYTHVDGMHNGLDLIIPTGTPLLAVSDGIIVGTEQNWPFLGSADPCIILWCYLPPSVVDSQGNRMLSNVLVAYGHLSDNSIVKRHAVVKAGDVIGKSGFPGGQPDNAHLHLETHLLSGDNNLPNKSGRRLLTDYKRPQPFDNNTPFNPLLFFSERLTRYYTHQGHAIGYNGGPTYPSADQLTQNGLSAWVTGGFLPDFFSLGYYQYDATLVIWNQKTLPFPNGLYDLATTNKRAAGFTPFQAYPADFLSSP